MSTMVGTADTQTTVDHDQRTHDHSRPLDTVILATEGTDCPWCAGLLRLLKQHLEDVAFRGMEVRN